MVLEITNRTKRRIRKDLVRKVAEKTLLLAGKKTEEASLSIVLVSADIIQKLNLAYRRKNKPTDVLSFNYSSRYNKEKRIVLGELILCPEIIAESAKENKITFAREFAFVLSHGILHILGMRHSNMMYKIQDKVCMEIHG